jgi:hypothetical protein
MTTAGRFLAAFCLGAAAVACATARAQTLTSQVAFDGRWSISLTCDDVREKSALIKGYTLNFFGDIKQGRLTAQYGEAGLPSSLTIGGLVAEDGTAELTAQGLTGKPEYTVGQVQPSTPYSYRLRGKFTPTGGRASRIELRPCVAIFTKQ